MKSFQALIKVMETMLPSLSEEHKVYDNDADMGQNFGAETMSQFHYGSGPPKMVMA